ncbi:hypothetical protein ACIBO2_42005 [Nonomuraea sp. NPDC050022]|uniref:hypothetical protein n=1 Tax=Nonomuraea sp. NPDC050022 TaxID=3364358 RepID=UPI00379BC25B
MKKGADFTAWVAEAERRHADGDPDWARGACLHRAVAASIQRFQVGERRIRRGSPPLRRGRAELVRDVLTLFGRAVSASVR